MPTQIGCPRCGHRCAVPGAVAGETRRCRACGQLFVITPLSVRNVATALRSRPGFTAGLTSGAALAVVLLGLAILHRSGALHRRAQGAPPAPAVARTASETDAPADIDEALADLERGTPTRRRAVALWLARRPPDEPRRPRAARALAALLADPDVDLRRAGARALATWGTPESVSPLVVLLADDPETCPADDPLENDVLLALSRLRDRRGLAAVARRLACPAWRDRAERLLQAPGPEAVAEILPYVNDPDPETRERARYLLASGGREPLVVQSVADLAAPDLARARVAAEFLGESALGGPERAPVVRALEMAVARHDAALTVAALKGIAVWAGNDAVAELAGLLADPDAPTRHAVLARLGRLNDRQAVAPIAERLASAEDRAAAARALVALGPVAARELRDPRYLEHPNREAREAAAAVLLTLDGTAPRAPAAGSRLARTIDDLKSRDVRRRVAAARALADAEVSEAARAEVARALEAALADADAGVRAAAGDALPKWATRDNVPALLDLLKAGRRGGREPLIAALARLKDARAVPALFECLRGSDGERKAAFEALRTLGLPDVEREAVAGLRRGEVLWRAWCCDILAEVGTRQSVAALEAVEREAKAKGLLDVSRRARLALIAIHERL